MLWTKTKNILLDIFFPPICLACQKLLTTGPARHRPEPKALAGGPNKLICDDCLSSIKLNTTLFCPVCRARLAQNQPICHFDSPYVLGAAGNYDDPVLQNLIHYFKYKKFENIAPVLSEILVRYLENIFRNWELEIRNFIVVPIPLHFWRERQRGFNQAKLLGEAMAKHFNLPLILGLKRIKNNKPQIKLKGEEARRKNIAGCFAIKNPEEIKGKNILLLDDVFTSGATMNEAVKILKAAGARKIIALVAAKA
ncbi:ComF family protein [Candidatus Wolfebacteria bacterium]|nr:ComF family protein [Candidatus Wolfebacteria bacterium]